MNAVMKPVEDGQLIYLSPQEIEVQEGFNSRTYFDKVATRLLEESLRDHGVQQNLVVRPHPDRPGQYLVIAGERRLRAARAVGLTEIPVLVRHVDEKQALVINSLENSKRQDISPAEEAVLARRTLEAYEGDREEAMRVLGWSKTKFEGRMLLLHAHPDVLAALARREIRLGIAELLSGLSKEAQEKNLPVVIEKGYSVSELRQKIERMALKLSCAIFDTGDCAACPHNSSIQVSLFEDGIAEGQCMNRNCFGEKTTRALEARKMELEAKYNVVFIEEEKSPGSWVSLESGGPQGVGDSQYDACKGCASFGALISSEPGNEGRVKESICFDPLCQAKKVKLAQREAAEASRSAASKGAGQDGQKATAKGKGKQAAAKPKESPRKVRELSVAFLRNEAARLAETDPATRRAVTLYALVDHIGKLNEKIGTSLHEAVARLHEFDDDRLDRIEQKAVAYLLREFDGRMNNAEPYQKGATALLAVTRADLRGRFTLDETFLSAHTKAGIEALMREAHDPDGTSFADWWEQKRGPFKKLMAKKNKDLIASILESDFDFSQWVPTCITQEVEKMEASLKQDKEKKA